MKLSDPKTRIIRKVNIFPPPEQIVASPRREVVADCGVIIAGNEVIKYPPLQKESKVHDQKKVDRESQAMGKKQADQIRELNLLSMGKQLLDYCKEGNAVEVKKLLIEGAPFIADWVGTSPLHFSVMNKHVEVTELLLKHGISKDTKNKVNRTPLHVAAHMGLAYMVKLLLTFGADVNCKDMLNMTPLHWAAESGDLLTAKILIDYGADIDVVNKFGKTACSIARSNKNMEIVRTILDTELLPLSTRALKVTDMRSKVVLTSRDMKPVAEILDPSAAEMKSTKSPEKKKKKKVVVITTDNDFEGPVGALRLGNGIGPPDRSESPEEMSADSAIKLLQSHGVTIMEPDKDTVVSSAVLNGHMIRLTEAGKLAFKSLEENVRFDKMTALSSDDEMGPTAKRIRCSNSPPLRMSIGEDGNTGDVIIGSSLSDCTIDLPSSNSKEDTITNPNDRNKVYLQRLRDKQKEILRHLEILEKQRLIKQNELTQLNQQIRSLENISNIKRVNP